MSSISKEDLKTILEFIKAQDESVKNTLSEEIVASKQIITEELQERLVSRMADDVRFRGPTGHQGADGPQGPTGEQGPQGPAGALPVIQVDEVNKRVRFQEGHALSEDTGNAVPFFSDWISLEGQQGPQGLIGEQGPQGEAGIGFTGVRIVEDCLHVQNTLGESFNLGPVVGPRGLIGETGPVGPKGEDGKPLTYKDLTAKQIDELTGPRGTKGEKGDPGKFPLMEADETNRRVRWQISEDINGWSDWFDIPKGDKGDQGDRGQAFMYEDFTPKQLHELTGPQGPKGEDCKPEEVAEELMNEELFLEAVRGPVGPRGPKGEKGEPGKDADVTKIEKKVTALDKKVETEIKIVNNKIVKNTEAIKSEIDSRISDIRFNRLNELLIPTASHAVAGDGTYTTDNGVVRTVITGITDEIINGTPVYIDNPVKASYREDTYDANNAIVYADAMQIVYAADGVLARVAGVTYLYRMGNITVDPRVIVNADHLEVGEYYYLDATDSEYPWGRITANPPQNGIAQIIGQAVGPLTLFVNVTGDPMILDRTDLQIQGRNAGTVVPPTTPVGRSGDRFGDVVWDESFVYICQAEYDGTSAIWRRSPLSTW